MKIKTIILDENLNEKETEYNLNELEVDGDENESMVMHSVSGICKDKTIASIDLPDGLRGFRVLWRRHRLYAQVCYPADAENDLKDFIEKCFEKGLRAIMKAIALSVLTPASLSAAVPVALSVFTAAFTECMQGKLKDSISFKVDYESRRR